MFKFPDEIRGAQFFNFTERLSEDKKQVKLLLVYSNVRNEGASVALSVPLEQYGERREIIMANMLAMAEAKIPQGNKSLSATTPCGEQRRMRRAGNAA